MFFGVHSFHRYTKGFLAAPACTVVLLEEVELPRISTQSPRKFSEFKISAPLPTVVDTSHPAMRRAFKHSVPKITRPLPVALWALRQIVPFKLREYVLMALWRKLPVGQQLAQFQMMEGQNCMLCGVTKDHDRVFKKYFYLQDSLDLIRRLWGVHVCANIWYEPRGSARTNS